MIGKPTSIFQNRIVAKGYSLEVEKMMNFEINQVGVQHAFEFW